MSEAKRFCPDGHGAREYSLGQYVSIIGRLGKKRKSRNSHKYLWNSANFYSQHDFTKLTEIFSYIITPECLNFSYINRKEFDDVLFVVWQHCLLTIKVISSNYKEFSNLTQTCNKLFEECLSRKRSYFILSIINQNLQRGEILKAVKNSSFLKDQKFYAQTQTHVGAVRNWVELTQELTKAKQTDVSFLPQIKMILPLIQESTFFDWTLPTLISLMEGNEGTSSKIQNLLVNRLSNAYSYVAHKALIKISSITKILPEKVKGLHPLLSEVQRVFEMLEKRPVQSKDFDSASEDEEFIDRSSHIRRQIRSFVKLVENPGCTVQDRQIHFYQLRLSLKKLAAIKSERKVKKFMMENFDWMRIRVWKTLFNGQPDQKFGDLLWNLLYPGFNVDINPVAKAERESLLALTNHLDNQEVPDLSVNYSGSFGSGSWVSSHDYCKYTPGMTKYIYRSINTERDIGYLKDYDKFRKLAILLKYSEEKNLYKGDGPLSEAARSSFKFSRGNLRFINEIHNCLWKDDTSVWSSRVLKAKKEIEKAFSESFSLLIYQKDPEVTRRRIEEAYFWKRLGTDEKYESEIIDAFVTGTCYNTGPRDTRNRSRIRVISMQMNYYPFYKQLEELKSRSEDLAKQHGLKKNKLDKVISKLEERVSYGMLTQVIQNLLFEKSFSTDKKTTILNILYEHFQPIMNDFND